MSKNVQTLKSRLSNLSLKIAQQKGMRERTSVQRVALQGKIAQNQEDARLKKEAHLLTLAFISDRREAAIQSIENMGTYALRAIYDEEYAVHFLRNEEKKTTAAFKMEIGIETKMDGKPIITGLIDERGGGGVETVSFALRIAALEWTGYSGPLLLDEAYKFMSNDEKIRKIAEFLGTYVKNSGRQVIFATHDVDLFSSVANNIVQVTKSRGTSSVSYLNE